MGHWYDVDKEGGILMSYELADEYMVHAITDDREEALELLEENPGMWVNVFNQRGEYVGTIEIAE